MTAKENSRQHSINKVDQCKVVFNYGLIILEVYAWFYNKAISSTFRLLWKWTYPKLRVSIVFCQSKAKYISVTPLLALLFTSSNCILQIFINIHKKSKYWNLRSFVLMSSFALLFAYFRNLIASSSSFWTALYFEKQSFSIRCAVVQKDFPPFFYSFQFLPFRHILHLSKRALCHVLCVMKVCAVSGMHCGWSSLWWHISMMPNKKIQFI